jgi:hypothetical protein
MNANLRKLEVFLNKKRAYDFDWTEEVKNEVLMDAVVRRTKLDMSHLKKKLTPSGEW